MKVLSPLSVGLKNITTMNKTMKNAKIAIIGLGYVGLPLARLFATKFSVIGFDINDQRIKELMNGVDSTFEVDNEDLTSVLVENSFESKGLYCTSELKKIKDCNYFIITVPTPVDKNNRPILTPLISASESVGKVLKKGDIVIYESTVYPGATEEDCIPVLEKISGLKFNHDFFAGYSPERINPGDKEHTVEKILKVTSGSTPEIGIKIDNLYKSVITAGTHLAPSIKVAEASKVIENSQRDINIAFVNELAKIFSKMKIDTNDVLDAASTKWNFINFRPGLVGGHCIGVDPYYLSSKSIKLGYKPEVILSGRKVNDEIGSHVANEILSLLSKKNLDYEKSRCLILGATFKENCPDFRNTKVIDIINVLIKNKVHLDIYDPWIEKESFYVEYGLKTINEIPKIKYEVIILAVSHKCFKEINISKLKKENTIVYDVKGFLDRSLITKRL